jgi:hypothetical protein
LTERTESFEGWAILELMGHRRLAGFLREQEIAGAAFIRIDVPGEDGPAASQFYAPAAVYCITPTTEVVARQVAKLNVPEPVHRWELPAPKEPAKYGGPYSDRDDDYPHDGE